MNTSALLLLLTASLAAGEPQDFDRLTFHAAPKPLSAEAKTEDWRRFLGPRHDLHSKETGTGSQTPTCVCQGISQRTGSAATGAADTRSRTRSSRRVLGTFSNFHSRNVFA